MEMHLPQELIDHIIDQLHDDKQSLRSCSLVSHSFQPSSRIGLFHKFRVKCSKAGIHRLIEFSNFLASKPSVAKYIPELELNGEETYCMAILPRSTLCSILTNLPNLHSLFLVRFVWKYSSQREVSSKDIFIPLSLRRLNLCNFSIKYSVCDRVHLPILNIFSLFGTIEELAIDRLWIPGAHHTHHIVQQQIEEARQEHENRTLIHKFQVSSFNLNASCPGAIFMMEIIRNTSSPRYLNLHLSTSLNANAARTLIAHSIPSLTSLTLNIFHKYVRCREAPRVSESIFSGIYF
ncbi:hypothetical protein C8Q75DRAFT_599949 [Abortiporus biennis]|nr:hypothetical protein C8Q75DRAFT_599949 [Abortiporus biennis]